MIKNHGIKDQEGYIYEKKCKGISIARKPHILIKIKIFMAFYNHGRFTKLAIA